MGARDAVYALLICLGLNYYYHMRPLGQAREFVEKESLEGFRRAFVGHKFVSGEVIMPQEARRVFDDKAFALVSARRLNIRAEHLDWNAARADFVVQHMVRMLDGSPAGSDVGHEVHVTLERHGRDWDYSHFEVRGKPPLAIDPANNPWEIALAGVKDL